MSKLDAVEKVKPEIKKKVKKEETPLNSTEKEA
jgi:hypothetical protein